MDGAAPTTTVATWESWDCPNCGVHNGFRSYCTGCRTELVIGLPNAVASPPGTDEATPDPADADSNAASATAAAPVPAPAPARRRGMRAVIVATSLGVALALVAAGGAYVVHGRRTGTRYPAAW